VVNFGGVLVVRGGGVVLLLFGEGVWFWGGMWGLCGVVCGFCLRYVVG